MIKWVINYKVNKPIVYNKGTKWEKRFDTFLYRYCENEDEARREVARMNKVIDKVDRLGNEINYYFVHQQEEMEG